MVKDPVCGMQIDERTSAAKSEYRGKAYYFCALSCKESFEKNPEEFTGLTDPSNTEMKKT